MSRKLELSVIGLAVVIALAGHLWIGLQTNWLPCTLDCGESYESYVAGRNLARFGFRYAGGLFDFAVSPDPAAHPVLYTHMLHLGMYRQAALFTLGVRSIHAQAALQTLPFFFGLLYLYLAVKVVTGSRLLAGCCLLQASSLYLLVALWGFQSERVWSWLVTFGVVFHLVSWRNAKEVVPNAKKVLHLCAAGLWMVVSFGMDYTFVLFTAALVVGLSVSGLSPLRPRVLVGVLALAFGLPFLLQQIHVASFVGVSVWWWDFVYSILRRIPVVSLLFPAPPSTVLEQFYSAHHILAWPGGGGAYIPLVWAGLIVKAYGAVLGWPFLLVLGAWVVGVLSLRGDDPIQQGLRLSLALAVATLVTFAVFGEYVASFYGYLLMPLVVHWVIVVLGLAMYVLLTHWRTTIGAVILIGFVVWRIVTEIHNVTLLPPAPYPGAEALAQRPGKSVVTYWISSAPSAYTDQWAATLLTKRWMLFDNEGLRARGFDDREDYYMLMAADPDAPRYRHPDLLLLPRLNAWGLTRRCTPFGGAVVGFADGCSDIETLAAMTTLPVVRRGPDYVLYSLRQPRRDK